MPPRSLLLLLAACAGSTKPEPATPTKPPVSAPVDGAAAPAPAPAPPAPLSDDDLEETAKPKDGQALIAWQSNVDGIAFARARQYVEARDRFRDAVLHVPDGAHFYNLCHALYRVGQFAEALGACNAILRHTPSHTLTAKGQALVARILAEAGMQEIEINRP